MANASLQDLMSDRGIPSLKALSEKAGVSLGSVKRLNQGKIGTMQVQTLTKIAQALEMSIDDLVNAKPTAKQPSQESKIQQEYDRLLQQLEQQETQSRDTFQREALQILEPWLLQWSAAVYATQQNAELPAAKLLPLLKPIDRLLESWGLVAIGTVGETLEFDPILHQSMNTESENLQAGDSVRVRFSGYRFGGKDGEILYRAKVVRG